MHCSKSPTNGHCIEECWNNASISFSGHHHGFTLLFLESEEVCIAPGTKGVDAVLQEFVVISRSNGPIEKDVICIEKQLTPM